MKLQKGEGKSERSLNPLLKKGREKQEGLSNAAIERKKKLAKKEKKKKRTAKFNCLLPHLWRGGKEKKEEAAQG